ncbi:MAG: type I glyceraldehyde-3-phosphate dehydrogenase [Patescibacteria group bacterium]|jgi:glyceraldehyde 3-phosphate dehydrogenase
MPRIAINGFGRIGRSVFKVGWEKKGFDVIAINDLTDAATLAYLLKHDTNYGTWNVDVAHTEDSLIVGGKTIKLLAQKDPAQLPWKDLDIDIVIESTGLFVTEEKASVHIAAGAKRVVISAPGKGGNIPTFVMSVNDGKLKSEKAKILSNASCTTNCVAPVSAIIEEAFGIEKAMMTTVHGYTASQSLVDAPKKDLREGRAAAENIVPTTTGAAIAVALTIPSLKGKFDGLSVRVPVPTVSLSDMTYLLKKNVTIDEVNAAIIAASKTPRFKDLVGVTNEPLVSSDFIGDSHSAVVDLLLTNVVDGNLVKVVAWYDNEWGYSHSLVELCMQIGT